MYERSANRGLRVCKRAVSVAQLFSVRVRHFHVDTPVFPRLQAVAVQQKVKRLPEVEDFVAVVHSIH